MQRLCRVTFQSLAAIALLVSAANVVHRLVLPPTPPDPMTFPRSGDTFASRTEGFSQHVEAVRDGGLVLRTRIAPRAPGPPMHAHRGFTEAFRIESGRLQIDLADRSITLGPGEEYRIAPGTPHRPHNPTDVEVVVASDEPAMPQSFGACLVQVYEFLDAADGRVGPELALRIAALDPICDSTMTDVPLPARAMLEWVAVPFARVAGYRNYYPSLALHPARVDVVAQGASR